MRKTVLMDCVAQKRSHRGIQKGNDIRIDGSDGIDVIQSDIVGLIDIVIRFVAGEKTPSAILRMIRLFAIHIPHMKPLLHQSLGSEGISHIRNRFFSKK